MFMEQVSIMMLTVPVFFPIVQALGIDPIGFAVIMLLSLELAGVTPPFGMNLFVLLGVAPQGTTLNDVTLAAAPFLLASFLLFLLLAFPQIALVLPGLI
ncbi:MAG: TRAP transporter large permease subunit [Rhodobacteraceae bacterium]|nr:TRAP transporter large permease subunit [Paracoccaceae bacterium]